MAFVTLAGGIVYLLSISSVSHAAAGGGAFWATLSDFVHLLATSVWIGMLALLVLYFRWARGTYKDAERYLVLASALRRFSIIAVISVSLLLFTGVVNSLVELGGLVDFAGYRLRTRAAGQAAAAHPTADDRRPQRLSAASSAGTRGRRPSASKSRQELLAETEADLNTTMRWELGVALAVLAVVALLVQITPTRGRIQDAGQAGETYVRTSDQEGLFVTLRIDPNQPGVNTFEVYLAGDTQTVESLRLEFVQPGGFDSISRLALDASNPPTFYLGQGPYLTEPGKWTVTLNIRRSAGLDLRLDFQDDVESTAPVASAARLGGAYDSPTQVHSGRDRVAGRVGARRRHPARRQSAKAGTTRTATSPALVAEVSYRAPIMRLRPLVSLGVLVAVGIGAGPHCRAARRTSRFRRTRRRRATRSTSSPESIERGRMLFIDELHPVPRRDGPRRRPAGILFADPAGQPLRAHPLSTRTSSSSASSPTA